MGLLPPKYNQAGRSRSRGKKSAKLKQAEKEHEKFLKSMGIDPTKKPKLNGAVELPNSGIERPAKSINTSDAIPSSGIAKDDVAMMRHKGIESDETIKAIEDRSKRIAPAYNKGPLQYVSDLNDLKTNQRRPSE